ncbi:MAG: hypothetical protein WBB19_19960 [Desulforhopalus sp.]
MNSDIRLSVGFRGHRKIKKLKNRFGSDAVLSLINLWIGVAVSQPTGVLEGWDVEDIALEGCWEGDAKEFVSALIDLKLVDVDESGLFSMHNWEKWQSWAIGAEARSQSASKAAKARWAKQVACVPHAPSIQPACGAHAVSNAPFLSFPILKKNTASSYADEIKKEDSEKPNGEFYLSKKKKKLQGDVLRDFNLFWEAFGYKKGRTEAADVWLEVYSPEILDSILSGARSEAIARKTIVRGGQTPKWAQGWLAGRRWEDEGETTGGFDCTICDHKSRGYCTGGKTECQSFREVAN